MPDMENKFAIRLCVLVVLLAGSIIRADAQTTRPEGAQQFAELGDMKLQGGAAIQDFRLGYRTLGKLNAQKSNAILWPTWLGGKSQDLLPFIGPGKVIDTTNYFVMMVAAIVNGVSSTPSNTQKQSLIKFTAF